MTRNSFYVTQNPYFLSFAKVTRDLTTDECLNVNYKMKPLSILDSCSKLFIYEHIFVL